MNTRIPTQGTFLEDLDFVLKEIRSVLQTKNAAYGNSVLNPMRIMSKSNTVEQLLVRIDDKLSRLGRGDDSAGEDTELDLLGYFVILRIARVREQWRHDDQQHSTTTKLVDGTVLTGE